MKYLRDSWLEWQRFCQKQEKILEQKLQSVFTGDVSYVQVTRFDPPILVEQPVKVGVVEVDAHTMKVTRLGFEVHDPIYSRDPGLVHLRNRWINKASRRTCGRQPFGLADA